MKGLTNTQGQNIWIAQVQFQSYTVISKERAVLWRLWQLFSQLLNKFSQLFSIVLHFPREESRWKRGSCIFSITEQIANQQGIVGNCYNLVYEETFDESGPPSKERRQQVFKLFHHNAVYLFFISPCPVSTLGFYSYWIVSHLSIFHQFIQCITFSTKASVEDLKPREDPIVLGLRFYSRGPRSGRTYNESHLIGFSRCEIKWDIFLSYNSDLLCSLKKRNVAFSYLKQPISKSDVMELYQMMSNCWKPNPKTCYCRRLSR